MGIQQPNFEPTMPPSSGSHSLSTITSQQSTLTQTANAQCSTTNINITARNDKVSTSHEADIIELDITPPTSPSSLATHLTSRMEEVIANKSVESNSNPGPHPEMIRSLNLMPTREFGKQPTTSMNSGGNIVRPSPFNSGPAVDGGAHNMR